MRSSLPLLALAGALLAGLGCDRPRPAPPQVDDIPPDGSAHYVDGQGIGRTLLTPIGTLRYGDRVEQGLPPPGALVGFEFAGSEGDTPALTLDVQGPVRVSLALYGVRDDDGLWGRPLRHVSGVDVLRIAGVELPADGYYFVLVRALTDPPGGFALQLDCEDCVEAICPEVEPCDLYCEQGYAVDEDACRTCACEENLCGGDQDCLVNEVCRDGVCRPAPSCQERCGGAVEPVCDEAGQRYANRCVAACEGAVGELSAELCVREACGPERPCAEGQRCVGGVCTCDCPPDVQPVCSVEGNTYSNLCQLECAGERLDYRGACVRLLPMPPCVDDADCPVDRICARSLDGAGVCALECRPDAPGACGPQGRCTVLPGQRGACLLGCHDVDRCPEATTCLPDLRGAPLCLPCDCPEVDDPVCAGGRLVYPSRCEAHCAGVVDERLAPGTCEDPPAELDCLRCPSVWAPVCADGTVRATQCDAECGERPARSVEDYDACFRQAPSRACRVDEDCVRSSGTVCAAEETPFGPPVAPEARCFAGIGECGCIEGTCGFRAEPRALQRCLDQARGAARPMP